MDSAMGLLLECKVSERIIPNAMTASALDQPDYSAARLVAALVLMLLAKER